MRLLVSFNTGPNAREVPPSERNRRDAGLGARRELIGDAGIVYAAQ